MREKVRERRRDKDRGGAFFLRSEQHRSKGPRTSEKTKNTERWNIRYPKVDEVIFYFKNFPEAVDSRTLEKRVKEITKVKDLFIPNRRDNRGSRFGFVRFEMNINR